MRSVTRRQALLTLAGGCTGLMLGRTAEARRCGLGIVTYALGIHQKNGWAGRHAGLSTALAFLEECRLLGAGGIQLSLGPEDSPHAVECRTRAERYEMHLEAIIEPPREKTDVPRFERDVLLAKAAGAKVARTVIMPGRRYEQFKTLAEFRRFEQRGLQSLQLAEPVLARNRFHLAVENHKDQRIAEKIALLKTLDSEWIGLCVDVANNFALMEDPVETIRAFAPHALTVHIKDMVVQEYTDGWLIADVALGEGFLPLKQMVDILRTARPEVKFNFESITRDPIRLPFRTEAFWATLPGSRAEAVERLTRLVKARPGAKFPVQVSTLPVDQQLSLERGHIARSLAYAGDELGI